MNHNMAVTVNKIVERYRGETVRLLQKLVRIPSVNHPPAGDEAQVQKFYAGILRTQGLKTESFEPNNIPAFMHHPARLQTHAMHNRPDVAGVLKGTGGGRSLMLLAHADVEQPGPASLWTGREPFSGRLHNGRIYGRGVGDDKSGMAINAMAARIIRENKLKLRGDLVVASVSDEEQGGSNGILALICKGWRADACLNIDGCNLDFAIAGLGGGCCTVELAVPGPQINATALLDYFDEFRERIATLAKERIHLLAKHHFFGQRQFLTTATLNLNNIIMATDDMAHGRFTFWFYLLPGEDPKKFKKHVENSFLGIKVAGTFRIEWMPRLLPAGAVAVDHPFAKCTAGSYRLATGCKPELTGAFMSDMGMVIKYGGFPCINFGPARWGKEGAAHQPNEFVEIETLMQCLKTVVFCTLEWCS
ncbi:MAG: M20 family metallopeptidase [Verrucomicrobia bacterium]|nr:M20 family metallopeptidase [Verrucomicrobiota bacterium]MBU1734549.1 M20 family metallopeptidase [Verrucomicrobiota bacterium]MBU1856618.1 M20 family metallopeptidase [Verrucomicrobiota bacterium]